MGNLGQVNHQVAQGRSVEAVAQFERALQLFEEEIGVFPEQLRSTLENLGLLL